MKNRPIDIRCGCFGLLALLALLILSLLTSSCGGGGDKRPTPPPPADDGRKTTLPVPADLPTPELGVVGIAGWARYEYIPQSQSQDIGGFVTQDEYTFHGADMIVCVDSACVPVISDQDGMVAVSFQPPFGGWSLGAHSWRIEYIGRTPSVTLSGSFTAIKDDE